MGEDVLALAVELRRDREPFALATVVRCERPTSAKPGAKALIRADGTVVGWIGGACAEPVVVREALRAMQDGEPRFVALIGEGGAIAGRSEGIIPHAMACHSGGTLEIYVEAFVPNPLLLLVGHGPVVETLAALGRATAFAVTQILPDAVSGEIDRLGVGPRSSVVIATHASADETVLEQVLARRPGYVSLIASRKRASTVIENLRERGVSEKDISRLRAPAGLDIGATTPEEIAVSILAEVVQHRRRGHACPPTSEPVPREATPLESRDPVCGMLVDITSAQHCSELGGRLVYFCCVGCKQAFDREPGRFTADLVG